MQTLVVLSGAGISAESGIKTFRDADGLWEGHDVMDVASPSGFANNPKLVLDFYNQRRAQLKEVSPNAAHLALAQLESRFNVQIITQNVDDLHEQAGSSNVLHLHGELKKVRPVDDETGIINWIEDLNLGHVDERGVQLRPHIVWFGEAVPMLDKAASLVANADIFLIIGTSLQVYPASGLIDVVPENSQIFMIDPAPLSLPSYYEVIHIQENAVKGIQTFVSDYLSFQS